MEYRVREGLIEVCNGFDCWKARAFLAERKVTIFWLFSIWWPVTNGKWRYTQREAALDATADAKLREPLRKALPVNVYGDEE